VYCANLTDNTVSVIDGGADSVVATVAVAATPIALLYDPVNRKVYCACSGDDRVSVIDCATNMVCATVAAEYTPIALCLDPVNNRIFAADNDASNLAVVRDTATGSIEERKPAAALGRLVVPTIIRSQLVIPEFLASGPRVRYPLFDATGRKAANLVPGVNDVSRLSPGLYFMAGASPGFARKVIIQR
jgi:YVTN family beta-propeller protein